MYSALQNVCGGFLACAVIANGMIACYNKGETYTLSFKMKQVLNWRKMMQFDINNKLKKDIQKKMMLSRKSVRITYIIEKIFLFVAIFGPSLYFIINVLDPNAFMGTIRGEVKKNYDVLILLTACPMGMLLTAWILVKTLRIKIASLHISDRVDETIEIVDAKLIYTFRIKYQSNPDERNIVLIDMEALEKVDYETETRKITIRGKMDERCINLNQESVNIDMSNAQMGEVVIYDYFMPSLKEYIENNYGEAERNKN